MPAYQNNFTVSDSFTRLANADIYADGDGMSDHATTPTVQSLLIPSAYGTASGNIRSVSLVKSDQDLVAAKFDIYIFDTTIVPAGFNDNAAIAITDAEWRTMIPGGAFRFEVADGQGVVTSDVWAKTNLDIPFRCASGSKTLYWVMVARDAYTPASAEVFSLRLGIEVD